MLLRSAESALVRLLVLMIRPRVSMISRFSSRSSSSNSSIIARQVAHIRQKGQGSMASAGGMGHGFSKVAKWQGAVLPAHHGFDPGHPKKPENARRWDPLRLSRSPVRQAREGPSLHPL